MRVKTRDRDAASRDSQSRINWLQRLDQDAPSLLPSADWQTYDWFMYARYPYLQPKRIGKNDRRDTLIDVCRETFNRQLSECENHISQDEDAGRVLEGLNEELRRQLAALLIDTVADFQDYAPHAATLRHLKKLAEAPSRKLNTKAAKVRNGLEELRDYASSFDPALGRDHARIAEECLERLNRLSPNPPSDHWRQQREGIKKLEHSHPNPEDPTTFSMVHLYWFFREGCGLTGDESEVRVAQIRNAFWSVPNVPYKDHYSDAESKGCPAVHMAVLRSSETGTE